jgi:predicted aspartyl protease
MTIPEICKLHTQNLAHNLRLAKADDERLQYLSSALKAFGEQIIPLLNQLAAEHFERSPEFDRARTAALELATVICGDFVRKCTDYSWGIALLEKVSDVCKEPQMKGKLVFYTNQLKKRWNIVEPGGLSHNPRAKKVRTEVRTTNPVANIIGAVLFFGVVVYLFTHLDLTSLVFPRMNEPRNPKPALQVQAVAQQEKPIQLPQDNPPQSSVKPFYSFTDNQGILHMVDNLDKVPPEYRKDMKVDASVLPVGNSTPVIINGNQVIVPVTITFRGRSVETRLLLDTGATVTSISESLATQLGVGGADVKEGKSTVADGRSVGSYRFKADSLAVANHILPNADTSILPGSGGKGYDGLLGMNFLKNFRYHVNFNQSVIEWGG